MLVVGRRFRVVLSGLFVVACCAADVSAVPGPVIISGLAPDAAGNFDGDQCRICDADRAVQGLCENQCAVCHDTTRTLFAGDSSTIGCALYEKNQDSCETAWQRNQVGLPLSCYFDVPTSQCLPCTATGEINDFCEETCSPCADADRNVFAGGSFPDSCRNFDGEQEACERARQLDEFTSAEVSCFYNATTDECHVCGVSEQLAGDCLNDCGACDDPSRTVLAHAPIDPCAELADDQQFCEFTWGFAAGFVPAQCIFTDGSDVNQGGFLFIQDGFDQLGPLVANGKKLAVCLGCNGTTAVEGFEAGFDQSALPGLGWTRLTLSDPFAIADFLGSVGTPSIADAGIVYLPSQRTDGSHDGISAEQVDFLNGSTAALASFVDAGGGLFALNQAQLPNGFGWLTALLPDAGSRLGQTCIGEPELTPAGEPVFPNVSPEVLESSDDPGFGYFVGDFGTLAVLATDPCHDVGCKDPAHTDFAGRGDNVCVPIEDPATCNQSWYINHQGKAFSCQFIGGGTVEARGIANFCLPCADPSFDTCLSTCSGCDDAARTDKVANCEALQADAEACATAWQLGSDGLNSSCFFDDEAGFCRLCSAENEKLGLCTNSCEPPAAARAVVIGLGGIVPATATPTATPTATATPSATEVPTDTATPTASATPEPTRSAEPTVLPTTTATVTATVTATATATPTATTTSTPVPSATTTPIAGGFHSFQCYAVEQGPFTTIPGVTLGDRFGSGTANLQRTQRLCAPADVNHTDASAPTDPRHLLGYHVDRRTPRFHPAPHVVVSNDFGTIDVDVKRPVLLLNPTLTSESGDPGAPGADLDHFQCYHVEGAKQRLSGVLVHDQFGELTVDVKRPLRLCAPVDLGQGVIDGSRALMCYRVRAKRPPQFPGRDPLFVHDRFGPRQITMKRPTELCVPSTVQAGIPD